MPPVNRYTVAFMNDDGNAYPQLSDFPSPEAREKFENTFLFLGWTSSLRGLFQCLHWRPESLFKLPNRREGERLPLLESLFRYNTVHLFQLPLLLYMLCPNSWSSAPSSIYRTRSLQSRILKERGNFRGWGPWSEKWTTATASVFRSTMHTLAQPTSLLRLPYKTQHKCQCPGPANPMPLNRSAIVYKATRTFLIAGRLLSHRIL